jgi:hypothetical protein
MAKEQSSEKGSTHSLVRFCLMLVAATCRIAAVPRKMRVEYVGALYHETHRGQFVVLSYFRSKASDIDSGGPSRPLQQETFHPRPSPADFSK